MFEMVVLLGGFLGLFVWGLVLRIQGGLHVAYSHGGGDIF
jgi:hypothetical protein